MARKHRPHEIFWYVLSFITILIIISAAQAQENGISSGSQPGKLYVLDAGNNHKKPKVVVVDQANGKVTRTYQAGDQPDMALSPDGTRLFVAYFFENAEGTRESVLDIYDTASGTLIDRVNNPEALQRKIPVYQSSMVMSPSGKQIYIEKYHWVPGAPGQRASTKTLGPVFLLNEGRMIDVVLGDGSLLAVDLATAATKLMGKETFTRKLEMQTALRGDDSAAYFSAAQETNNYFERYDQIVRIDPATMAITGKMTTSVPFFDLSISPDHSTLFTVNPERATITVIDAPSLKEISQFSVGMKPIFAIAAP
jgi:DNA-binding beta-propeller fold protein YncE